MLHTNNTAGNTDFGQYSASSWSRDWPYALLYLSIFWLVLVGMLLLAVVLYKTVFNRRGYSLLP